MSETWPSLSHPGFGRRRVRGRPRGGGTRRAEVPVQGPSPNHLRSQGRRRPAGPYRRPGGPLARGPAGGPSPSATPRTRVRNPTRPSGPARPDTRDVLRGHVHL